MLILKNATILTAVSNAFVGDIAIEGNIIIAVSQNITAKESDTIVDLTGHTITPGFIDAHTHIGMFEDGMSNEGSDGNEASDPITPEMRAIDGINPFDPCFHEALSAGVTTVVTGPGSANVIGGQFVILNTYGNSVEDMIFNSPHSCPVAMKAALGENPKRVYEAKNQCPTTRMGSAAKMRRALRDAVEYNRKLLAAEQNNDEKAPDFDFALDCLIPVIRREIPLKIHCHRADDILTAIRIANEFDILFTLDHCTEGYMIIDRIAPELKKNLKGIIIGPLLSERCKIELKNQSYNAPRILDEAGVPFAMMTDAPVIPQMYLPVSVSLAIREGLSERTALSCITINAAKVLGIDNLVGSIEAGKLANLAVFAGDPFDCRVRCKMVFINGQAVYDETK